VVFSLRLSKQLEDALVTASRLAGVSKSEYLRQCLEQALAAERQRPSAYELGKNLFGKHGSGRGDLARNAEPVVKEIIRAKANRRRRRTSGRAV